MKTALNTKRREPARKEPARTKTRYPSDHKEKRERDIEIFGRSVMEIIRQRPGIQETELRRMYTMRERPFVDEALLRLKSGAMVTGREEEGSLRLYLQKPGSTFTRKPGQEAGPHGLVNVLSPRA